jgi:DNA (cytosine-5)-methyltransferase 1
MRRKRLLDLYCCQGGPAKGYRDAGFEVVGIDIDLQPRYPFEFHQGDAIEYLLAHHQEFDAVHASPPCQLDSECQRIQHRAHPDLIGPTRAAIERTGLPYVIENVEGARPKLRDPATLCGAMFALRTYRHRLFETGNGPTLTPPPHPAHLARQAKMGRPARHGEYLHIVGNFSGVDDARRIMSMPWANRDGLREAIPPAYTEHIGRHLIAALEHAQVPA